MRGILFILIMAATVGLVHGAVGFVLYMVFLGALWEVLGWLFHGMPIGTGKPQKEVDHSRDFWYT